MAYSVFKRLLPHSLRTFLRDLDSAYQERLKEIEIKNQQIEELQHTLQESQNCLLKEIEVKNQQIEELQHTLEESQNRFLKGIEVKNQQVQELQHTLQESQNCLLKEIEVKNQYLIELEKTSEKLLKALESENRRIQEFNMSDEDYEKLSKAGLFIIGSARSGTSILCDCLNLSPDVFLLGEANI